ncbi:MAG: hypothetical protein IPK50_16330 [Fibrobacterota bacterium]|nr:MAG: hypothetical protein IPK50_16330 [Fibrobacterota bacterium]
MNPIQIDIHDVLLLGRFGESQLGTTRSEIFASLGPPDNYSSEAPQEMAEIWKYGNMEFYFQNHQIYQIFSDADDIFKSNSRIKYSKDQFTKFDQDEFESFYTKNSIKYEIRADKYDNDISNLHLPDKHIKLSFRISNACLIDSFSISIFNENPGF